MIGLLVDEDARNAVILDVLKKIRHPRKTLVLSERREHVKFLHDKMSEYYKSLPNIEALGRTCGFYVGGIKRAQLKDTADSCSLIFGTYRMASEGLDIPSLDTMVLATPKYDVEQSIGRILRKHDGKQSPFIIDIVDPFANYDGSAWKRHALYKKCGYSTRRIEYPERAEAIDKMLKYT